MRFNSQPSVAFLLLYFLLLLSQTNKAISLKRLAVAIDTIVINQSFYPLTTTLFERAVKLRVFGCNGSPNDS